LNPIHCPNLAAASTAITHGFFTRQGGISSGIYDSLNIGPSSNDAAKNVSANRKAIVRHLGLADDDVLTTWQHHSADVVVATHNWLENRPKADAIVTATPNLPIAVVTADCGPVLYCDPENNIIGATHAGWRGATGGVLEATVDKMLELGADRNNIHATLGPTISAANYEVGPEFVDNLITGDNANDRFLSPSPNSGHAFFDLPNYILDRLKSAGVSASWTGQCTYADEARFFSYRRMTHRGEADYGRQISAITIATDKQ